MAKGRDHSVKKMPLEPSLGESVRRSKHTRSVPDTLDRQENGPATSTLACHSTATRKTSTTTQSPGLGLRASDWKVQSRAG